MKTININVTGETIIKNSRFITILYKVNEVNEVEKLISLVKSQYKNANHYCYAYIIDNVKKFSDDGEPSGTAGNPILQVLEKNDLNYILAVVVRYFGGIKLGAGGLVRAYTKCVTNILNDCSFLWLDKGYFLIIEFGYDYLKYVDFILKNINVKRKSFNEMIRYEIDVDEDLYNVIKRDKNINIVLKEEKLIEKMDRN